MRANIAFQAFQSTLARGLRFKCRRGQKFGLKFLFHAHSYSTSGTTSQWIWISEPVPRLELTYGKEGRVERKGADTLVMNKKHERNPMTQEQKRRP